MDHSVEENWASVQRELRALSSTVEILAVTKAQPWERVASGIRAGMRKLGCNYAQEGRALRQKVAEAFPETAFEWYFIGHVQSRKVPFLLDYDCLQSLDRLEIAESLNSRLEAQGRKMSVLVEVNIGEEAQKSGISAHQVKEFLGSLTRLSCLQPRGLMAMPPSLEPIERRRPYFQALKVLYDELGKSFPFSTLSMGTSEDYRVAVEEGATQVRLGSTLFGARPQ